MRQILFALSFLSLVVVSCGPMEPQASQLFGLKPLTKEQVLSDFDEAVTVFRGLYGPMEYKTRHEYVKLDFENLVKTTRERLETTYAEGNEVTDADFYGIMKQFVTSFKDGHVGMIYSLNSENTNSYKIPLNVSPVKDADGKWQAVVVEVGEKLKSESIAVGDVIVKVDGVEPFEFLKTFVKYRSTSNDDSDRHLINNLFMRDFYVKELKPTKEFAFIEFQKSGEDYTRNLSFPWEVVKEEQQLPSMLKLSSTQTFSVPADIAAPLYKMGSDVPFFMSEAAAEKYGIRRQGRPSDETLKKFGLTPEQAAPIYYATYEFQGTDFLLLRQQGYSPPAPTGYGEDDMDGHIEAVRRWIQTYKAILAENENVDMVIIDQTHNPGGSSLYVFDFFRLFITRPAYDLIQLNNVDRKWVAGYLQEYNFWKEKGELARAERILGYAKMMENASDSGRLLSDPVSFDYDYYLQPHKDYSWKKPVMVLADELAGSCGDIFPMLVKANKIAKVFGQRTMGLGGNVETINLANSNATMRFTRGLFTTFNPTGEYPDSAFVENNGIQPDFPYEHTLQDVRDGYVKYIEAFSKQAQTLVANSPAPPPPPSGESKKEEKK